MEHILRKGMTDKLKLFKYTPGLMDRIMKPTRENKVYTDISNIHEIGVFSNRNFQKDEDICVIEGDIVESPAIKHKAKAIQIDDNIYIVPNNIFRFLNHSCNSNAKLIYYNNTLILKAKRKIKKYEEITFNYCTTDYELTNAFICNCDFCQENNLVRNISGYKDLPLSEKTTNNDIQVYLLKDQKNKSPI